MALLCDMKSDVTTSTADAVQQNNEDLEDGEIEDDDEEVPVEPENKPPVENVQTQPKIVENKPPVFENKFEKYGDRNRPDRGEKRKHEEKKKTHLTEAEKHVMHLHKLERLEREKREKYRREQGIENLVVDDFASNIERQIANVLKKDRLQLSEEEKDDGKHSRKRKKKDKDKRKNKQQKFDPAPQPAPGDVEGGAEPRSPEGVARPASDDERDSDESNCSSDGSREGGDRKREGPQRFGRNSKGKRGERREGRKYRDRSRERRAAEANAPQMKDAQSVCVFYMQGKCHKGEECPYSHEVVAPMKLELCKFYLMDCCAKGDKCLYMHSEFPCKFYHTGLPCHAGDKCKFAHGKSLSEGLKQILFKHIETAPREILGGYPRMSREETFNMITQTQKNLEQKFGSPEKKNDSDNASKFGIPSLFDLSIPVPLELIQNKDAAKPKEKTDKPPRNRPSRWQDPDPISDLTSKPPPALPLTLTGFYSERDQDLRISSNGDVDMRTLPPPLLSCGLPLPLNTPTIAENTPKATLSEAGLAGGVSALNAPLEGRVLGGRVPYDFDQRLASTDVDIRRLPSAYEGVGNVNSANESSTVSEDDSENLKIVEEAQAEPKAKVGEDLPLDMPKPQRDLFLRIQARQRENLLENQGEESDDGGANNVNWYSDDEDDEDDDRLTIKVDGEDGKENKEEEQNLRQNQQTMAPSAIQPMEALQKLGDLSKIDISEEVTKLLTTMSQSTSSTQSKIAPRDPRQRAQPAQDAPKDPRTARLNAMAAPAAMTTPTAIAVPSAMAPPTPVAAENKPKAPEKLSIYEQGAMSVAEGGDVDLRGAEDLDFRVSSGRPDVDLRQLNLPFKAIQNYTPATEIDASVSSHPPIKWEVRECEIPRPDYTGLKLSPLDAKTTGDPRLRKIFRLSVEERDSPASPKETTPPISGGGIRADPRRRKSELGGVAGEMGGDSGGHMSYTQQLNLLQTSTFYQSLTSNQKVLLNQELANQKAMNSGGSQDPLLSGILASLGLVNASPGGVAGQSGPNLNALSILASVSGGMGGLSGLGQSLIGQQQTQMVPGLLNGQQQLNPAILSNSRTPGGLNPVLQQPGLLGAAPGIPNLVGINFDPRNGGLLGSGPGFGAFPGGESGGSFGAYPGGDGGGNFGAFGGSGEEFYQQEGGFREGRFSRDGRQRRGGRGFGGRGMGGGGRGKFRNAGRGGHRGRSSPPS